MLLNVQGLKDPNHDLLTELVNSTFHGLDKLFVGNFAVSICVKGFEQSVDVSRTDLEAHVLNRLIKLVLIKSARVISITHLEEPS